MAEDIEARVIQKIATEAEWAASTILPRKGEFMIVGDSSGTPVNIKVGNGVDMYPALPYMFDSIQQNVNYVAVTGTALPTPEADVAFSIVGEGSYTFGGNPAFTVPSEHWGVANWISGTWSFVDMGELPQITVADDYGSSTTEAASQRLVTDLKDRVDDVEQNPAKARDWTATTYYAEQTAVRNGILYRVKPSVASTTTIPGQGAGLDDWEALGKVVNVVNTTGSSTEDAASQKLVTDLSNAPTKAKEWTATTYFSEQTAVRNGILYRVKPEVVSTSTIPGQGAGLNDWEVIGRDVDVKTPISQTKRFTNPYVEPELGGIEFNNGTTGYLSDIIKSFEISFANPQTGYFKNDGTLRRIRVNFIQEGSTYYSVSYAIENLSGGVIAISGADMQVLKENAPNPASVPFSVTKTISEIGEITIKAIYDFTAVPGGNSVADSIDFTNGKLSDSVLLKDRDVQNKAVGFNPNSGKAVIYNDGFSEFRTLPNFAIANPSVPPLPAVLTNVVATRIGSLITWMSDMILDIQMYVGRGAAVYVENNGLLSVVRINSMQLSSSNSQYRLSGQIIEPGKTPRPFSLGEPLVAGDMDVPLTIDFKHNLDGSRNYEFNFTVTAYWNAIPNILFDRTSTDGVHYGVLSDEVARNARKIQYNNTDEIRATSTRLLDDLVPMLVFGSGEDTRARACFISAPDPHWDFQALLKIGDPYHVSSALINYVPFLIIQGDLLHTIKTREETIAELDNWKNVVGDSIVPIVAALGDHDFANDQLGDQAYRNHLSHSLTKADQREHLIQPCLNRLGASAVAPAGVCYYYVNDAVQKVRHIILDGRDQPMTHDGTVYDYDLYWADCYQQTQLEWLANTALNLPNNDWSVVVHSHIGILNMHITTIQNSSYSLGDSVSAMWAILVAYKNKTSASVVRTAEIPINIDVDFTSSSGRLAALCYGHTHDVRDQVYDGINLIGFANAGDYAGQLGPRIPGTNTMYYADYVLLDQVTKDIRCIRTGRRGNRLTEARPDDRGHRFLDTPLEF